MIRGFEKISKEKNNEDVKLPIRTTKHSVAYDFFSPKNIVIPAGKSVLIKTGIKAYFQEDEVLHIYTRSGLGSKHGIQLRNSVGVIDSDYYNNPDNEGELLVTLLNTSDKEFIINKGDRFCQAIFQKILLVDNDITPDQQRIGGYGSTDNT